LQFYYINLTNDRRSLLDLYTCLKFLAATIPEIWRGPQNSKSNVTTLPFLSPNFAYFSLVPFMANLHSKFKVSSFNSSHDRESQNSKSRSHYLFPTPFVLILHFLLVPPLININFTYLFLFVFCPADFFGRFFVSSDRNFPYPSP